MSFAGCCTNKLEFNFEFVRTAHVFSTLFTNRLKKCQRLLTYIMAYV